MRDPKTSRARLLIVAAVSTVLAGLAFGQTAVWTGPGSQFTTGSNWLGGVAPPNNGTTTADFSFTVAQNSINVGSPANVLGLYFNTPNATQDYSFSGTGPLTIGTGGISFQGGIDAIVSLSVPLVLSASQTIFGGTSGFTALYGPVSETGGSSTLTTNGRVYLFGDNSFTGGLNVAAGTAYVVSNTAAGTGTITVAANASIQSYYTAVTLANPLVLESNAILGNGGAQASTPQLTFSNTVTLGSSSETLNLLSYTAVDMQGLLTGPAATQLILSGASAQLPSNGGSQLVLQGTTSSNIAGITVLNSELILAPTGVSGSAYGPTTVFHVGSPGNPGYLGLDGTFSQPGAVAAFLSVYGSGIGSGINGTLGFDSFQTPTTPATFNDAISLAGFNSSTFLGLGSSTGAILGPSALITPLNATTGYLFGGGGGKLIVESPLADDVVPTALTMTSAPAPLTLVLQGSNTYTGGTLVNGGVLIFDAPIPATGGISLAPGGYVGYTESAGVALAQGFVGLITSSGAGGVIGFDTHATTPRTILDPINLSSFNSDNNPFIGSATAVILSGTITPANNAYQFTGVKGGDLTIATNLTDLTGAASVTIGLVNPIESNGSTSTVNLTGTNSYSGGTTFNSGTLFIQSGTTLGATAGTVTIPDTNSYMAVPYLAPFGGSVTIANPIFVGNLGSQPGVSFGNAYTSDMLVLSGGISDASMPGILGIVGPVTLSGTNTYSGGTEITSNNNGYTQINVTNSSSLGTGPLTVYAGGASLVPSGVDVTLPNNVYLYNSLTLGSYLNLNRLILNGVISGGGSLDIESNVGLGGLNTYSGGTIVNNANVLISSTSPFGTGSLVLNSSTLSYGTMRPTFEDLTGDPNAVISLGTGSSVTLDTDTNYTSYTYNGAINGDGTVSLTKTGTGVEFLTGTSTYGGGTTINGGTLIAGSNQALGSGPVTVTTGTTLGVAMGATVSNSLSMNAGSTLAGSGTFTAASGVTFSGGTTVSPGGIPGQSIATLTFSNSVTFGSGGAYVFNVTDAGGAAGVGYSTVNVGGTLTVTATAGSPFVVDLMSVDGSGNPALATFSATNSYSWTLLSASTVSGFVPADFTLNTAGFQNSTAGGVFSFAQNGNAIDLNFTPVPEPSTDALIGLGMVALALIGYRKRRAFPV